MAEDDVARLDAAGFGGSVLEFFECDFVFRGQAAQVNYNRVTDEAFGADLGEVCPIGQTVEWRLDVRADMGSVLEVAHHIPLTLVAAQPAVNLVSANQLHFKRAALAAWMDHI
jgi:hypothetical protein